MKLQITRSCPKCKGRIIVKQDEFGGYLVCIESLYWKDTSHNGKWENTILYGCLWVGDLNEFFREHSNPTPQKNSSSA